MYLAWFNMKEGDLDTKHPFKDFKFNLNTVEKVGLTPIRHATSS